MNRQANTQPAAIPILAYHLVTDRFDLGIARVTTSQFKAHLNWLVDRGYRSLTLRQYSEKLSAGQLTGDRYVVFTFDDAYECLEQAAELMGEAGFIGTCFAVTSYVGKNNDWDYQFFIRKWRHASFALLRDLSEQGWEVGSHSHTHRNLTQLAVKDIERELSLSRQILQQELGTQVDSISYPFGRTNQTICRLARNAGYRQGVALGIPPALSRKLGTMGLARIGMYLTDSRRIFAYKIRNLVPIYRVQMAISAFSAGTMIWKKLWSWNKKKSKSFIIPLVK